MSLAPGARLGPYGIVALIGAGGMGEVYRARDTKLNRDVALKVLPDSFATDTDRLARFKREAQVLASLNHPNIAGIYGFEDSGETHALVLELVEGPTLADLIEKGPIPIDDALPIARQIADALEAAHEHGIVHRDLKPANIKLRADGTVKVLDFGLAKALEPGSGIRDRGSVDATQSPTITSPAMTRLGVIMGTAAYMAPEQAKGKPVDKRADIWAYGCVLFEMLTGKSTFKGDDVSDIVVAILRDQPDWSALPAQLPSGIRQLLLRCLEKDPRLRLRDIGEARIAIDNKTDAAVPSRLPRRYVGFGAGGKLKKIDIAGGPPVTVTDLTAPMRGASWSPAGVILFSTSAVSPVLRVLATGGTASPATALDKGEEDNGNRAPWFLPDGRHFLYDVPSASGDMPIRVGSLDEPGRAGPIVAQANSNAVYAQGHLLYLRETTLMAQPFDVERLATSGEALPVAERVPSFGSPSRLAGFTVSSTGLLVYQTGASGRFQLAWFDRNGKEIGVVGDPAAYGDLELSQDGTRAAVTLPDSARRTRDIWFYDLRQGLRTQFTFDPADEGSAVWSRDGTRAVFSSNRKGNYDLYEKSASGATNEQVLLEDSSNKYVGSWSQDGRFIQYFTGGGQDVWVLPIAGDRKPFALLQTRFAETQPRFSPDGRWIAYTSNESGSVEVYVTVFPGPGGKWKVSAAGGRLPRWRRDGRELFYLAPDNKLVAVSGFSSTPSWKTPRRRRSRCSSTGAHY